MPKFSYIQEYSQGYVSNFPLVKLPQASLLPGSRNLIFRGPGMLESFKGFNNTFDGGSAWAGGSISLLVGRGWGTLGTNESGDLGSGNLIEFVGRSLWFVGTGTAKTVQSLPGATPLTSYTLGTATSIPQICVLNSAKNGYQAARQVGLNPNTSALTLAVPATMGAGFVGKCNGTYGAMVSRIRSSTGTKSLPSPISNLIAPVNQTIAATFPSIGSDGSDTWRLYFSPKGFGVTGPYLYFKDIRETQVQDRSGTDGAITTGTNAFSSASAGFTADDVGKTITVNGAGAAGATLVTTIAAYVSATAVTLSANAGTTVAAATWTAQALINGTNRTIELEFYDTELGAEQPPTSNFPAQACLFMAAIANCMLLIGSYEGLGVQCSLPNQPEAFPADYVSFLPEPVIGVAGRPQDGYIFIFCQNSIHVALWTGATSGPPVIVRPLYDTIGIKGQKAACVVGNVLYGQTSAGKPFRITESGEIDIYFGLRIEKDMESWDSSLTAVSYDELHRVVAYANGTTILCYHIDLDVWSAPIDVPTLIGAGSPAGTIKSAFSRYGAMYVSFWTGTVYNLYQFNRNTTGSNWIARGAWNDFGQGPFFKTIFNKIVGIGSNLGGTYMIKIYKDYSFAAALSSENFTVAAGDLISAWVKTQQAKNLRMGSVEVSGAGSGDKLHHIYLEGTVSNIRAN